MGLIKHTFVSLKQNKNASWSVS